MQKFSLLKNWQNINIILLCLLIPIFEVLTILMYTYFKDLLNQVEKMLQILKEKCLRISFVVKLDIIPLTLKVVTPR